MGWITAVLHVCAAGPTSSLVVALKDKVQNGLDEARMLMLATQVVIAVDLRAFFEPGYDRLSLALRAVKVGALATLTVALVLLMLPGSRHRIVERGDDSEDLHRFIGRVTGLALFPIAVAVGLEVFLAAFGQVGAGPAAAIGAAFVAFALGLFYGIELAARRRRRQPREGRMGRGERQQTSLDDKIKHVLTETRVVMPGVQALLAFQFAITLSAGFAALPGIARAAHLVASVLSAVAVVLLLTPAAWHRIVERGESSERFHRLASAFMLAAMPPIALDLALELFVVLLKSFGSPAWAAGASAAFLVAALGLWFGLTMARRETLRAAAPSAATT